MSYIDLNGTKVYFESRGSGDAIVFLHSLGTSSKIWEEQMSYFEKKYHVISIDARGHGKTDSTIPFSFKEWASDIIKVLDELKIQKAHFVGLSMGGHVILDLYQIVPEKIKSMVLSNTFAKVPEEIREEKFNSRMELLKQDDFIEQWAKLSIHEGASESLIEKTIRLFDSTKEDYKSTWIAVNQVDYISMLNTIEVPVLILTGDMDKAAPIPLVKVFHDEIEGSELDIIHQAGHFSNICNPTEFNEKVSSFFTRRFYNDDFTR